MNEFNQSVAQSANCASRVASTDLQRQALGIIAVLDSWRLDRGGRYPASVCFVGDFIAVAWDSRSGRARLTVQETAKFVDQWGDYPSIPAAA